MPSHQHLQLLATSVIPNKHSQDPRDLLIPAYLPTPLDIFLSSTWMCLSCRGTNHYQQESALRPLGFMQCKTCGKSASFGTKVNVNSLVPIEGKHFMVSLPVGEKGPPKTIVLWVCCGCGRSHVGHAHKVHRLSKRDTKKKPDKDLAIRLLHAAKRNFDHHAGNGEVDDLVVKDDGLEERRAFKVAFHKACKCGRRACDSCLKFKVEVEGEWIAQEVSLAVQPKFMDVVDRAAMNFRNAT